MLRTIAVLATVILSQSACTTLIDLVVDSPDPKSGGQLQAAIVGQAPLEVTALASGNPMVIRGMNTNLIVAMTCGDDAEGHSATQALASAGGEITLIISDSSRSAVQVHAGGASCIATTGSIHLTADSTTALTGDFSATGVIAGTATECSMSGTLSAVPQHR